MQENTPVTNEEQLNPPVQAAAEAPLAEAQTDAAAEAEPKPVKKDIFGRPKKEKPKKSWQQELLEWIMVFVVACVLAFVIRTFLGELVRVDGNSMYATLHDGEVMVVEKTHYSTAVLPFDLGNYAIGGDPERFDVVICHYPGRGSTNFVKRVVGLPGDEIAVEVEADESGNLYGVLYVNGVRYAEPYLVNRINYYLSNYWERGNANYTPVRYTLSNPYVVPEGQYFVLGDNRSNSNDSHTVGPIDRNMIIGHVCYIIMPASGEKLRAIPNGLEDDQPRVLEEGL